MFNVFDHTKRKFLELVPFMWPTMPNSTGMKRDLIRVYFAGALGAWTASDPEEAMRLWSGMMKTIINESWMPDETWNW